MNDSRSTTRTDSVARTRRVRPAQLEAILWTPLIVLMVVMLVTARLVPERGSATLVMAIFGVAIMMVGIGLTLATPTRFLKATGRSLNHSHGDGCVCVACQYPIPPREDFTACPECGLRFTPAPTNTGAHTAITRVSRSMRIPANGIPPMYVVLGGMQVALSVFIYAMP